MTSPRVLVDATAVPADRGGVGRYLDGLLSALPEVNPHIGVVCRPEDAAGFEAAGVQVVSAPGWVRRAPLRMLWEQFALVAVARRHGYEIVHSPHYTFPLFGRIQRVVTIHDLTFFTLPEVHTRVKRAFFRYWLRRLARRSFPVVAVSSATASAFTNLLGADPARIWVSHHGYDAAVFRPPTRAAVDTFAAELGLASRGWIAFLGTLEPRKNLPALIRAHARVDAAPALILAGSTGWDAHVDDAVATSKAAGVDVRRLGYLPLDQLSAFLGGAEIVAYPSLGEGFGLPVLEAMAAGACVLTTRELALPEVGGDAVAYTGTDEADLETGLRQLLSDDARRRDLRDRAARRAVDFTWHAAAERHAEAYAAAAR